MMVFGTSGAFDTDEVVLSGRNVGEIVERAFVDSPAPHEAAASFLTQEVVVPMVSAQAGSGVVKFLLDH